MGNSHYIQIDEFAAKNTNLFCLGLFDEVICHALSLFKSQQLTTSLKVVFDVRLGRVVLTSNVFMVLYDCANAKSGRTGCT